MKKFICSFLWAQLSNFTLAELSQIRYPSQIHLKKFVSPNYIHLVILHQTYERGPTDLTP